MELSQNLALSLIESTNPFPVDFDDAWQWAGYSRKDHAKEALLANLVENVDFRLLQKRESAPSGGRTHWEEIYLSIDGFKMFCMMAQTEKGREVRLYFLECERQLRGIRERLQSKTKARQAAKPLILEALEQFQKDHAIELRDDAHHLFVKLYKTQKIELPLWVYEAFPSISRSTLYNWRANGTNEHYGAAKGRSKLLKHPDKLEKLEQALQTNPDLTQMQAYDILDGVVSPSSIGRYLKAKRV